MTSINKATVVRAAVILAGLGALVWANYFLRHTLEQSDQRIYSFLPYFYKEGERAVFVNPYPFWKLLLPIKEIGYTWTTTSLILTHVVEIKIGVANTWYLFNALLILASFAIAQAAFRSLLLSFTVAICMGFGTQLYHTYAVTGTVSACLILIYYQLTVLCGWRVIDGSASARSWRIPFLASLLVTAICYEGWLDLLVFGWMACALVAYVDWSRGATLRRGLAYVFATSTVVGLAYLVIKILFGFGQTPGGESDIVFNYPMAAPAVEDVISNIFGNFYLVVTNFLPPSLVSSTAFFRLGGDQLVALQHGYDSYYSYLVVMQSLFLWRYAAGVCLAVGVYAVCRLVRGLRSELSAHRMTLALTLLMMLTGGPTHALVKARPMHSMPLLSYHVLVGVIGAAYLIGYLLLRVSERRGRLSTATMAMAVWGVLLYGALARPALLAHEAAQVGFVERIYPDPLASLQGLFHLESKAPGGFAGYRLGRVDNNGQLTKVDAPAYNPQPIVYPSGFNNPLPRLPGEAPRFDRWRVYPNVTLTESAAGFLVQGTTGPGGSGYQLQSPPIPVPRHRRLLFRMNATMEAGRACLGILDDKQRGWLLPADGGQSVYELDTGDNGAVILVVTDCSGPGKPVAPVFTLEKSMTFATLDVPDAKGAR